MPAGGWGAQLTVVAVPLTRPSQQQQPATNSARCTVQRDLSSKIVFLFGRYALFFFLPSPCYSSSLPASRRGMRERERERERERFLDVFLLPIDLYRGDATTTYLPYASPSYFFWCGLTVFKRRRRRRRKVPQTHLPYASPSYFFFLVRADGLQEEEEEEEGTSNSILSLNFRYRCFSPS